MRKVGLSEAARKQFDHVIDELTLINPVAARNLVRRFDEIRQLLAEFPEITERGRKKGTRKISMPPFILMSRRVGDDVEIFAIRHARQRDALAPRKGGRD
jgi:plasmid stabilization system protein ParE